MFETAITILAILCSASVVAMCGIRWYRTEGFKSAVYLGLGALASLVSLANVVIFLVPDATFLARAIVSYLAFATAILLPAARALGNATYEPPEDSEERDVTV